MNKTDEALNKLLKKYDIKNDQSLNLLPGWKFFDKKLKDTDIPLLSWRSNRKYVELNKLTSGNIVEHVCMLRFCCLTDKNTDLSTLMYREFDLCEFIGQGIISSVHATFSDNRGGNVIVKLDNGIICSIEIGNLLPEGSTMIDRHEIIARRGVASDIVVDTQIPQKSIYTYTEKGNFEYKDVDNELYGLSELEIESVRSSFNYLTGKRDKTALAKQHEHLSLLIKSAYISDKDCKKIEIK